MQMTRLPEGSFSHPQHKKQQLAHQGCSVSELRDACREAGHINDAAQSQLFGAALACLEELRLLVPVPCGEDLSWLAARFLRVKLLVQPTDDQQN